MFNDLTPIRGRKRNGKKNRKKWAMTSHLRNRPRTGEDFATLKRGNFKWFKDGKGEE